MSHFHSVHLDVVNQCLWRDGIRISLSPKAFAIFQYLADRAGQLVTKQQLLDNIWPNTYVLEEGLKTYILAIRKALGDDARQPRYIQTQARRGYCLIGPVSRSPARPSLAIERDAIFVGRQPELDVLNAILSEAFSGQTRIVFISGEVGIGRSALIQAFLKGLPAEGDLLVGVGRCFEQSGQLEAYYPVLDAIGQLLRCSDAAPVINVLATAAPTWLAQFPGVAQMASHPEPEAGWSRVAAGRMLREITNGIEAISAHKPLLLVLEDLQWSDSSTIELIHSLARRRSTDRIMLVCDYRAGSSSRILNSHLLELKVHGQCFEMRLDRLKRQA